MFIHASPKACLVFSLSSLAHCSICFFILALIKLALRAMKFCPAPPKLEQNPTKLQVIVLLLLCLQDLPINIFIAIMIILLFAASRLKSALVRTLPLKPNTLTQMLLQRRLCYLLWTLYMRTHNRLIFAFFVMRANMLMSYLNGAAKLVVFALELSLAEDVAHQDVSIFIHGSWTTDWAWVGFLLPFVDAFSAIVVLAFFTFHRIFDYFEANLTEEETACVFFLLSEALSWPPHS